MEEFWARLHKPADRPGPNYWIYFAEQLVRLADIPTRALVLDVGTYDGNVLFKAMNRAGEQGYGVGIDIDYDGFQEGLAEALQQGREGMTAFAQMDANTLGFPANTFDIVLANFVGWDDCFDFERMAFINTNTMMDDIMRVLKPGGQVGIGSWVEQSDIDWIVAAFHQYLPECGGVSGSSITCYAKENLEGQQIILQNAGFENIHVNLEKADFASPDAGTWWRQMQQAANEYFRQVADQEKLAKFKRNVLNELSKFQLYEGILFSKTVSFAFGTKPTRN